MAKLNKILGMRGFTLVELMATVAIVGVLAAIAVPNYMKYQRKARQTEAKVTLASDFTLETSAKQAPETGNSFHGCLGAMGASVVGNNYYASGFKSGFSTTNPGCGPAGITPGATNCLTYSWNGTTTAAQCGEGPGTTYFNASVYDANNAGLATGSTISSVGTQTSVTNVGFTIGATGFIGGSNTSGDQWEVNQNKVIYQINDGVM